MAAVKLVKLDEYNPDLNKTDSPPPAPYARKSDRACDFCRRRKTRCDGALTLGSKCTNCRRNQCPCTYQEASRPRGPPKAYVTALEDRIERFERLFKRLRPEADFTDILGPSIPRDSWKHEKNEKSNSKGSGVATFASRGSQSSSTFLPSAKPGSASILLPTSCSTGSPSSREQSHSSLSDDEDYSDEDWDFSLTEWPKRPQASSSKLNITTTNTTSATTSTTTTELDSPVLEDREGVEGTRFHGKSSFFPLVQVTRQYMHDATYAAAGEGSGGEDSEREGRAYSNRSDPTHPKRPGLYVCDVPKGRRAEYWMLAPWEEAWERKRMIFTSPDSRHPTSHTQPQHHHPIHIFPPLDLLLPLLSLYFHHQNSTFPLLHAPTFYSQLRSGLHERDAHFAGVVWAAIAVASRWSTDRRVLWDGWGSDSEYSAQDSLPEGEWSEQNMKHNGDNGKGNENEELEWASAGWRFFMRSLDGPSFTVASLNPPSLYDLQFCSLAAMFLRGSSLGPAGWVIIGMGLRKAMDVGAHRKKVYKYTNINNNKNKKSWNGGGGSNSSNTSSPRSDSSFEKVPQSVENELWKRAFWMLVLFDRIGSASLGRPCCVREEDFDIDLPLEVDDEYWVPSDPSQKPFTQPPGKPSTVSGFVGMLKLTQIMAHALRTIYCIDKSKVLLGLVSDDWPQQIVSQLNTALDDWVESVPDYLRWSPTHPDDLLSNQSATLYTTYYLTLILIYRPFSKTSAFIPDSSHDDPSSSSSSNPTSSTSNSSSNTAYNPTSTLNSTSTHNSTSPSPTPTNAPRSFPFPADSICMSAAQSAVRIIDTQMRRGLSNIPNMISVAQMSAVTLLMGLYTLPSASAASSSSSFSAGGSGFGTGSGSTSTGFRGMGLGAAGVGAGGNKADPMMAKQMERDGYMADILKCIKCLELSESRWIMARRFLSSFCASLPDEGTFRSTRRGGPSSLSIPSHLSDRDRAYNRGTTSSSRNSVNGHGRDAISPSPFQPLEKPPVQIGSSIPTVPSQSARAWVPSNTHLGSHHGPNVHNNANNHPGNNNHNSNNQNHGHSIKYESTTPIGLGPGPGSVSGAGAGSRFRGMEDTRDLFMRDNQDTEAALASRGSWSWFRGHHQGSGLGVGSVNGGGINGSCGIGSRSGVGSGVGGVNGNGSGMGSGLETGLRHHTLVPPPSSSPPLPASTSTSSSSSRTRLGSVDRDRMERVDRMNVDSPIPVPVPSSSSTNSSMNTQTPGPGPRHSRIHSSSRQHHPYHTQTPTPTQTQYQQVLPPNNRRFSLISGPNPGSIHDTYIHPHQRQHHHQQRSSTSSPMTMTREDISPLVVGVGVSGNTNNNNNGVTGATGVSNTNNTGGGGGGGGGNGLIITGPPISSTSRSVRAASASTSGSISGSLGSTPLSGVSGLSGASVSGLSAASGASLGSTSASGTGTGTGTGTSTTSGQYLSVAAPQSAARDEYDYEYKYEYEYEYEYPVGYGRR